MLVEELNTVGDKGLVAAVILQAIQDSIIVKHPRPPLIVFKKNKIHNALIKLFSYHIKVIFNHQLLSCDLKLRLIKLYNFKMKEYYQKKITHEKEVISYTARKFLNSKNKLFCFYCFSIDLDPEILAKKAFKYYRNFDKGISNEPITKNVAQTSEDIVEQFDYRTEKTIQRNVQKITQRRPHAYEGQCG